MPRKKITFPDRLIESRSTSRFTLAFPHIPTMLNHCWPLFVPDIFRHHSIELHPVPLLETAFLSYLEQPNKPMMAVIPASWLSRKELQDSLRPIAVSHLYHGYSLVGQSPTPLASLHMEPKFGHSPTPYNLFRMLAEMRITSMIGRDDTQKAIACWNPASAQFLELMVKVAQSDPRTHNMLAGVSALQQTTEVDDTTGSFLSPLHGLGHNHFQLVVGHGLTAMIAAEEDGPYKRLADYRRLRQVIHQLPDPITVTSLEMELERLREPVVVVVNTATADLEDASLRELCVALANVTAAASQELYLPSRETNERRQGTISAQVNYRRWQNRIFRHDWEDMYEFTPHLIEQHMLRIQPEWLAGDLRFISEVNKHRTAA